MSKTLVVIDLQNDYFPGGKFPLFDAEVVLDRVVHAILSAKACHVPVIVVQHVASGHPGAAPFFNEGTPGVDVHPRVLEAASGSPVIVKHFADAFVQTSLLEALTRVGTRELLVCGMMTQNCVTHTAISKSAGTYDVSVLSDCCTTVTELLHQIALHALSTRIRLELSTDALPVAGRARA